MRVAGKGIFMWVAIVFPVTGAITSKLPFSFEVMAPVTEIGLYSGGFCKYTN